MFWIWSALVGAAGGGGTARGWLDWPAPEAFATPPVSRPASASTVAALSNARRTGSRSRSLVTGPPGFRGVRERGHAATARRAPPPERPGCDLPLGAGGSAGGLAVLD